MQKLNKVLAVVVGFLALWSAPNLLAQQPAESVGRQFPAFAAGEDAYRRAEAKRQYEVAQQVGTIEYVRWLNGRCYYPFGASMPADRAAFYGYGGRAYGGTRVFERWPYLPGDIWGFSYSPARARLPAAPRRTVTPTVEEIPEEPMPEVPVPEEPPRETVRRGPISY